MVDLIKYIIFAFSEQCLRDEEKPLFGALPSRQDDCLAAVVKFAAVCNQVIQPDIIKKHCVNLLSGKKCFVFLYDVSYPGFLQGLKLS